MKIVDWSFQGGNTPRKQYWKTNLPIQNSRIQILILRFNLKQPPHQIAWSCLACRIQHNLTTCQWFERIALKDLLTLSGLSSSCLRMLNTKRQTLWHQQRVSLPPPPPTQRTKSWFLSCQSRSCPGIRTWLSLIKVSSCSLFNRLPRCGKKSWIHQIHWRPLTSLFPHGF
jgi:hypothetical protein